jgi:curved DNA-binding protein CbpA
MAAADHGRPLPDPDLYQLLGVARGASGGEVTQAWRRRALAEHPDRRPRDAAAPARFRALAEAYQVPGDPARRAAYDGLLSGPGAAAPGGLAAEASARRPRHGSRVPVTVRPAGRVPGPPLRAGPVRMDVPRPVPASGSRRAEDDLVRLAVRYLAGDRDWRW